MLHENDAAYQTPTVAMPIRINCKHCGKRFSAWDDLIGKPVKCPKCGQEMVVPGGDSQLPAAEPAAPSDSPPTPPPGASPPAPKSPGTRGAEAELPPADNSWPAADVFSQPLPGASSPPPETYAAPPVSPAGSVYGQSQLGASDDDLDDSDELPFACPHCDHPMPANEELCDRCGYHQILKRCIDVEGVARPDKSTGFERVFRDQLTDANSAKSTLLGLKIAGAVFALLFLVVCHPWSWLVAGAGVVAFLLLRQRRMTGNATTQGSEVNRDFLANTLWSTLLEFQRLCGWRQLQWPFPKTKAMTLHDSTFTDEDLAGIENLAEYQALDLQGTQISDNGLAELQQMKQLRFLVVRSTRVTAAGAARMQQALPDLWIWF